MPCSSAGPTSVAQKETSEAKSAPSGTTSLAGRTRPLLTPSKGNGQRACGRPTNWKHKCTRKSTCTSAGTECSRARGTWTLRRSTTRLQLPGLRSRREQSASVATRLCPHLSLQPPAAQDWLKLFQKDGMRYPLLLLLGASFTGKTEWAKTLFRNPLELKVGSLEHFPEKMRSFAMGGPRRPHP